jgi:hypothetical protein
VVHTTSAIVINMGATKIRQGVAAEAGEIAVMSGTDLTMRLSDAGLHQRQTKALYPDHRFPPWPNGDAARRSLEPIVRFLVIQVVSEQVPKAQSQLDSQPRRQ